MTLALHRTVFLDGESPPDDYIVVHDGQRISTANIEEAPSRAPPAQNCGTGQIPYSFVFVGKAGARLRHGSYLIRQEWVSAMARLTVGLELEQVRAIVSDLDSTLDPVGFARLHGGVSDVYRIDLAGAEKPLILKIYGDEPA
jgi:hypothetical protein